VGEIGARNLPTQIASSWRSTTGDELEHSPGQDVP
jgi:hypothetical protein